MDLNRCSLANLLGLAIGVAKSATNSNNVEYMLQTSLKRVIVVLEVLVLRIVKIKDHLTKIIIKMVGLIMLMLRTVEILMLTCKILFPNLQIT